MAYADYQILAPGRPYGQSAEKSRSNRALSSFEALLRSINDIESKKPGMTFVLCMAQTIFKSVQEFSVGFLKKLILRLKLHIHSLRTACTFLGIPGSIIVDE